MLDGDVADQPDLVPSSLLEVVVNPVDEVVEGLVRVDVVGDLLVAFEQLPFGLADLVNLRDFFADVTLGKYSSLKL